MNKKYLFLLVSVFCLVFTGAVEAAAIKVTPAEIKIESRKGELIQREIIIENPDQNVALYEVYSDNFSNWVSFTPASFVLESKESEKVILSAKNDELGLFYTTISVKAKPMTENGLKMNSGVKIPLEIAITENGIGVFTASVAGALDREIPVKNLFYIIIICILALGLALVLLKKKGINPLQF